MLLGSVDFKDVQLFLGPQLVLGGVSASVGAGDRLAIVGPNGVGKTTLLRVLVGEVTPDSGAVRRSPATATIGLLPQERDARPGETLMAYLARRTGVAAAEAELEIATGELAQELPGSDERYSVALEQYLALGAADLDVRAPGVLAELGLEPSRLSTAVSSLSGGQLARLALTSVLLARFDVLLLDEPTNDLDIAGLEQLEEFLLSRQDGLVLVSHDRTFLERVSTSVLEIDEFSRSGTVYGGGFAVYLEERERARALALEAYEKYEEKREALTDQARRQKEWARAGVTREQRHPRDNDKAQRDFRINRTQRNAAGAARALRAAENLEVVEEPRTPWELRLSLDARSRSSDRVAGLSSVVVTRGSFQLGPVSLDIRYGDRLAVVGPNGSGKSTLIAVLLGLLEPSAGSRWLGRGVVVGQIDQVQRGVAAESPGADVASDRAQSRRGLADPTDSGGRLLARGQPLLLSAFRAASGLDETEARSLLAKFGLEADDVLRLTGSLSPGERTRADLALLVARQANLLVLDEPTNHLDLPAVEQLEQALASYDGTLILASHDRKLLSALNPTHFVHVESGQVTVESA